MRVLTTISWIYLASILALITHSVIIAKIKHHALIQGISKRLYMTTSYEILVRNGLFRPDIIKNIYKFQDGVNPFDKFLQAVVDGDIDAVHSILNTSAKLKFLIEEPQKNHVIESKLTWQKFFAENALIMAMKRNQIGMRNRPGMVETLLFYFDMYESELDNLLQNLNRERQTNRVSHKKHQVIQDKTRLIEIKNQAFASWKNLEYTNTGLFQNQVLSIPEEYSSYLQSLVEIIIRDPSRELESDSIELEMALTDLMDKLIPSEPQKIDNYPHAELFLYAAYKAYEDNFDRFITFSQRVTFRVKIIGLIQSVQTRNIAEVFCQGLYNVVEQNGLIRNMAAELQLPRRQRLNSLLDFTHVNLVNFYRDSRDSTTGLGFYYCCELNALHNFATLVSKELGGAYEFAKLCKIRQTDFVQNTIVPNSQLEQPSNSPGCLIL